MGDPIDLTALIDETRANAGPQFVSARVEAETEARGFLDEHAGAMTAPMVSQLGRTLNRHSWGTGIRFNRFRPGLSEPLVNHMVRDLDRFNSVTNRMWRADENDALEELDRVLKEPSYLPGAGQLYPTTLLYLRFAPRMSIWFKGVDAGLAAVSTYTSHLRSEGVAGYLDFCERAFELQEQYGLQPQELDAVLSEAQRRSVEVSAAEKDRASTPTITRAAFEFLQELAENNTKEWFAANRSRYEADLRDPLAAVLEEVAARYVRGLDPKLNTQVKRDEVLARINKWAPDAAYYTYYWGAFSRAKKQEDSQLYVNVQADYLHYGIFLGSASLEQRTQLATNVDLLGSGFIDLLHHQVPDLAWDQDDLDFVEIDTLDDLANWANGPNPHVRRILEPNHPLVGSPELVDDIGHVFLMLYPMAAITWGEMPAVELPESPEEELRPEYSFDDLVAETGLPAERLEEWLELLRGEKRAGLFFGPPGTGKTWVAERLGRHLAGVTGETTTVQFHPSFSYEDFIEGLRPVMDGQTLGYEIRAGVFKNFCDDARGKEGDFVFVVDEINRAELGSVLGEVMMLIEYRNRTVPLPYSQESFSIPKNVVLLATMNTADRSLALVDFALRRRFHAIRMPPDRDVLQGRFGADGELAILMFDLVQDFVSDPDFAPGHSYWMTADPSAEALDRIWRFELRPYLEEYWFESRTRLDELDAAVQTLLGEGV